MNARVFIFDAIANETNILLRSLFVCTTRTRLYHRFSFHINTLA